MGQLNLVGEEVRPGRRRATFHDGSPSGAALVDTPIASVRAMPRKLPEPKRGNVRSERRPIGDNAGHQELPLQLGPVLPADPFDEGLEVGVHHPMLASAGEHLNLHTRRRSGNDDGDCLRKASLGAISGAAYAGPERVCSGWPARRREGCFKVSGSVHPPRELGGPGSL